MCIRRYKISGWSMAPSLREGARVYACTIGRMRVGDVVICRRADAEFDTVKRIVAIEKGDYVIEGDNLTMSTDSRHFGPVNRNEITAKVLFQYYPRIKFYV